MEQGTQLDFFDELFVQAGSAQHAFDFWRWTGDAQDSILFPHFLRALNERRQASGTEEGDLRHVDVESLGAAAHGRLEFVIKPDGAGAINTAREQ